MMNARTFFENQLQVLGITKKLAASFIECSGATITNYIVNGKELKFTTAIKSTDPLFNGDDSFVKMFCVESEKPENIKASLEYLSTNRYFAELRKLIFKCDSHNILNEWSDTYKVVLDFQQRSKSYEELLEAVYDLLPKIKDEQLQVLLKIVEANIHHNLFESSVFARLVKAVEWKMDDLQEDYFKTSISVRLIELKSQHSLFVLNDKEQARKYAKEIISRKIGTKFTADGYNIIGTSYMFENKEKALKNIEKSIKILRKIGCHDVADSYEFGTKRFIKTYWGEDLAENNETNQSSERAFMLAKRGEGENATEILDGLEMTPFRMYYKGVAQNDPMIHIQSLVEFVKRGERFYAQLPYNELIKTEAYREVAQNILK